MTNLQVQNHGNVGDILTFTDFDLDAITTADVESGIEIFRQQARGRFEPRLRDLAKEVSDLNETIQEGFAKGSYNLDSDLEKDIKDRFETAATDFKSTASGESEDVLLSLRHQKQILTGIKCDEQDINSLASAFIKVIEVFMDLHAALFTLDYYSKKHLSWQKPMTATC